MAVNGSGRVRGVTGITKNLAREIAKIEGDLNAGMAVGLTVIRNDAFKRTPREFGFLRGGLFTAVEGLGKRILGRVGYTASYAPFVHEMPDTTNWTEAGTENLFLEKAVIAKQDAFLEAVRRFAII